MLLEFPFLLNIIVRGQTSRKYLTQRIHLQISKYSASPCHLKSLLALLCEMKGGWVVASVWRKHVKTPIEAGGGIGEIGTDSSGLRFFSGSFGILLLCLLLFFKNLLGFFRAVLVSQRNWEKGREISHILPALIHTKLPPLSISGW